MSAVRTLILAAVFLVALPVRGDAPKPIPPCFKVGERIICPPPGFNCLRAPRAFGCEALPPAPQKAPKR